MKLEIIKYHYLSLLRKLQSSRFKIWIEAKIIGEISGEL